MYYNRDQKDRGESAHTIDDLAELGKDIHITMLVRFLSWDVAILVLGWTVGAAAFLSGLLFHVALDQFFLWRSLVTVVLVVPVFLIHRTFINALQLAIYLSEHGERQWTWLSVAICSIIGLGSGITMIILWVSIDVRDAAATTTSVLPAPYVPFAIVPSVLIVIMWLGLFILSAYYWKVLRQMPAPRQQELAAT